MSVHAIIPARGGSKGIPRKNVVDVCGKPLIAWTIGQALASQLVEHVTVATDCDEIACVAADYGAAVYRRSAEVSTDDATSESVICEWLTRSDDNPAVVVFLQCTSPIRQPHDIDNAVKRLIESGADSVFSARHVEGYTWTDGLSLVPDYNERRPRQQHQARKLEENGSIYAFRPHVLFDYGKRLGGIVRHYEMHVLDSFQVDAPADIDTLEQLIPMRLGVSCLS